MDLIIEYSKLLLNIFRYDIIIGFILYSIVYFIIIHFIKDKTLLKHFDKNACNFIIYGSFIYTLVLIITSIIHYINIDVITEKDMYRNIYFGKYWYATLIEIISPLLIIQTLRFKIINKYLLTRITISLIYTITFEKISILIATYNSRSAWNMFRNTNSHSIFDKMIFPSTIEIIFSIIIRILIFAFIVQTYIFLKNAKTNLVNLVRK